MPPVHVTIDGALGEIVLDDPGRRNALGAATFDGLESAVARVEAAPGLTALLLSGEGPAFCAGFDLEACASDGAAASFIERLGALTRRIRRLPCVVVVAAHGAAIAGGCALVSACDLVVSSPDARFGYPVHALGISPAVTLATLGARLEPGPVRHLLMSGAIIDGREAHRIGLVSCLAGDDGSVGAAARSLATGLLAKGHHALRTTKAWLNELDGSLDDHRFIGPLRDSAADARRPEAVARLRAAWPRGGSERAR